MLTGLADRGWRHLSVEATVARAAHAAVAANILSSPTSCATARELVVAGYRDDVEIACEVDVSHAVPVLSGGSFRRG